MDELDANLRKHNAALHRRAVETPDEVKRALQVVGHALPDEYTRAHYVVIREYIGFLQATCAVHLAAAREEEQT